MGTNFYTYRGVIICLDPHFESTSEYQFVNVGKVPEYEEYDGDPHIKGLIKENFRIFYASTSISIARFQEIIDEKLDRK